MISGKFDPHSFFNSVENVALNVAATEIFGLLNRTIDLPPAWAALVTTESGSVSVVRAGANVKDEDSENVLFVRTTPVAISFDEADLDSRDHFQCRAAGRFSVSVIPERSELKAFTKAVLGSHRVVNTNKLSEFLAPTIRAALADVAAKRDAAMLIGSTDDQLKHDELGKALEALCFSAGLQLEPGVVVQFDSAAFGQVRNTQQRAARQQAEHEATRQLEKAREQAHGQHLDHLATMLHRLEQLAKQSPEVELQTLVHTFSEKERSEIYAALFNSDISTSQTKWIVVAAGSELLYFDPSAPEKPQRRLTIEGEAGSIRSLQQTPDENGQAVLWLGAATGVYRLPVDSAAPTHTLTVPDAPSVRGGFNSVAQSRQRVLASHSELGIYCWKLGECWKLNESVDSNATASASAKPTTDPAVATPLLESLTKDARAIRGIQTHDNDAYCSIDDRVVCWPIDSEADKPTAVFTGSRSTITAICPTDQGLFAGNSEGDVLHWPIGHHEEPDYIQHGSGRPVESLWHSNTKGIRRLIYCVTSLSVQARVIGDTFTCHYEAGGQTLRRVEVAADRLVATNELRDRLFIWPISEAARPSATIAVSSLCGRSIQDVCLVPSA